MNELYRVVVEYGPQSVFISMDRLEKTMAVGLANRIVAANPKVTVRIVPVPKKKEGK